MNVNDIRQYIQQELAFHQQRLRAAKEDLEIVKGSRIDDRRYHFLHDEALSLCPLFFEEETDSQFSLEELVSTICTGDVLRYTSLIEREEQILGDLEEGKYATVIAYFSQMNRTLSSKHHQEMLAFLKQLNMRST